ncbi:hypothetical protein PTTG_01873 [Puccinia triticina 1-1 BBBD Race 1]|uniref:Uncharacterized protein n=2 Tax=Puccinia triticina TaxID=208348 RepID=A0A0C4DEY6_PUCT1|nr:uncharacterized protein PtA15_13A108 [Puccinia triticina]OAV86518.1 hypothetical protein PTTG_01873 [Puccinia triticina 1-1 BBBD Race 1]WAQ90709.1 hypothetical protein PtA15_13A108 [Puccinia triticina]WAR60897.1 hypothetical protein PtB15_13B146 [Puccinia triticina]
MGTDATAAGFASKLGVVGGIIDTSPSIFSASNFFGGGFFGFFGTIPSSSSNFVGVGGVVGTFPGSSSSFLCSSVVGTSPWAFELVEAQLKSDQKKRA